MKTISSTFEINGLTELKKDLSEVNALLQNSKNDGYVVRIERIGMVNQI